MQQMLSAIVPAAVVHSGGACCDPATHAMPRENSQQFPLAGFLRRGPRWGEEHGQGKNERRELSQG